jgi:hypothetical protein
VTLGSTKDELGQVFFFFSFNFENYGVMAFCKLSVFQPTTVSILSNTEIILMLCNKGSLPDMTIL